MSEAWPCAARGPYISISPITSYIPPQSLSTSPLHHGGVTHPSNTVGLEYRHSPQQYRGAGVSSLTPAVPRGWCTVTHPSSTVGLEYRHSPAGVPSLTPAVPWDWCTVTHPSSTVGLVYRHSPQQYRGTGVPSLTPAVPWGWCIITREWGRQCRIPQAPAASRNAPMLHA